MKLSNFKRGRVVGTEAPKFELLDHRGFNFKLDQAIGVAPIMLAFYPGYRLRPVCQRQFCDYRDNYSRFLEYKLQIFAISPEFPDEQARWVKENDYPFLFLSDRENTVAKAYGTTSFWMLNNLSRAIYILNKEGLILYQYVEPTVLTKRGSGELVAILSDLRNSKLI